MVKREFVIPDNDLSIAGEASSSVRNLLIQLGVLPAIVKRASIAMYEAEINTVIHANGGTAIIEIDQEKIYIRVIDDGPGIADINLAMQEGYSTASDQVREMGFGAGMGLPNIKKNSDLFKLESSEGKGTTVHITVFFRE